MPVGYNNRAKGQEYWRIVARNYCSLPNIQMVLGSHWPKQMERKNRVSHPLIELLWVAGDIPQEKREFHRLRRELEQPTTTGNISTLEDQLRYALIPPRMQRILTLEHLDSSLNRLIDAPNVVSYRRQLRNRDEFWDVYSEIECAANASISFVVGLKPKVGGGELDFRLPVNGSTILIEVRAAKLPASLESGKTGFIGNRVQTIIAEEAKQFQRQPRSDKSACVLVIDASGTEIQPIVHQPSPDSIPRPVSAVAMYKMDFWWDERPHYSERILVINKQAKNLLSENLADDLFKVIIPPPP